MMTFHSDRAPLTEHEANLNRARHCLELWSEGRNGADPWAHVTGQLGADWLLVEGSASFRRFEFEARPESELQPLSRDKIHQVKVAIGTADKPSAMALDAPSVYRIREAVRHHCGGVAWTQFQTVAIVRAEVYGEPHRLMIVLLEEQDRADDP